MTSLALSRIAEMTGGRLTGADPGRMVSRISADSRDSGPGTLFFALIGEKTDGHVFARRAVAAGAAGVVRADWFEASGRPEGAFLLTEDPLAALGRLGAAWRSQFEIPVVGITGSAGKTTTTALLGLMARKYFEMKQSPRRAWVGGNIGNPLIGQVAEMHPDDLVILELSSFQLELMTLSPQVAVVLNITLNHLDRHGTMQAYTAAKARILNHQHQGDVAVLNRDDAGSWELSYHLKSDLISFGFNRPEANQSGTYIHKDSIYLQIERQQLKMFPVEWIRLRGQHNISNVLAACAAAAGASLALPAIQSAVEEFTGVAHRLEFVRNVRGADWYNDSIATAPERTLAALLSFQSPVILLLGGRDKNLPWEKLAEHVRSRVRHVILFGEAAELISSALGSVQPNQTLQSISRCASLQEAVQKAAELAQDGDSVLLSPGGTSYDAFKDFEERGECFRQWVNAL